MTTRVEQKITAIAEATGRTVLMGRVGHKDEWFARCGDIEVAHSPAFGALTDLETALIRQAGQVVFEADRATTQAVALQVALLRDDP